MTVKMEVHFKNGKKEPMVLNVESSTVPAVYSEVCSIFAVEGNFVFNWSEISYIKTESEKK